MGLDRSSLYKGGGAARNAVAKPLYRAQMLANHFIKDIPAFWDHFNAQKTEMNPAISDIAAFWDHLNAQKTEMNAAISRSSDREKLK